MFTSLQRCARNCIVDKNSIFGRRVFLSSLVNDSVTAPRVVKDGNLFVRIPLPSRAGLTPLRIPLQTTVRDLIQGIKQLDPNVPEATITNKFNQKLALSSSLTQLSDTDLLIKFEDSNVRIKRLITYRTGEVNILGEDKYSMLKQKLLSLQKPNISFKDFNSICIELGADQDMCLRWMEHLRSEGVADIVKKDNNTTLILAPGVDDFKRNVADVLRRDNELLDLKIAALEDQLKEAVQEEQHIAQLRNQIVSSAKKSARIKSASVLGFLTAQFSGLFYLVYEVYSWDVMEPASYFLTLTYTAAGVLYFSFKKKEPTYDHFLQTSIERLESKLAPVHGYDGEAHRKAAEKVEKIEKTLQVVRARVSMD